ncbi:MAG TPA: phytanoyl-CoA dioxygenase family protein, partial [Ramlibacter sp.]|nr:phytanoyl-CoA dioxygenase family protein [Ramlibacter sp.]
MLTLEQIAQYHEQGFLVVENFLPPDFVRELGRLTSELVASAAGLDKTDAWFDLEPSHRKGERPRVRRLKHPNGQHPLFAQAARHPKILDAIEALNGRPGVRFTHPQGKVNIKAAEYGSAVEWHQDWAGYPHTNDDLLSVSIPLDGATPDNGPLLVLPGTHKGPIYDHHVDGVYRSAMHPTRDGLDFSRAVPLLGDVGMVYFHHVRIVHGSALNRSTRDRRLLINQYAAVDAWPLMGVQDL